MEQKAIQGQTRDRAHQRSDRDSQVSVRMIDWRSEAQSQSQLLIFKVPFCPSHTGLCSSPSSLGSLEYSSVIHWEQIFYKACQFRGMNTDICSSIRKWRPAMWTLYTHAFQRQCLGESVHSHNDKSTWENKFKREEGFNCIVASEDLVHSPRCPLFWGSTLRYLTSVSHLTKIRKQWQKALGQYTCFESLLPVIHVSS